MLAATFARDDDAGTTPEVIMLVARVSLMALTALHLGAPARAAEPAPPTLELRGRTLVVQPAAGPESVLDLGCDPLGMMPHGDRVHVACGADGAVEVALGPPLAVVARRTYEGAVTGHFLLEGAVWVRLARVEARPLIAGGALPAPGPGAITGPVAPAVTPPLPTPSASARLPLLERHAGRVVIDAPAELDLTAGQHVELFVEREVDLGGGAKATREERVAVGRVTAVGQGRAEVDLGLGERVPAGAFARPTKAPLTASMFVSPRLTDLWELRFAFRPFLALGTVGFGMVDDLRATYRFDAPVALHLVLEPAGVGVADDGNILALAGNLIATYDSALFEVGLGLGWSAVNGDLGWSSEDASGAGSFEFERVKDGFSIAQLARLGAIDGLNVTVLNSFLLYEDKFNYGGTRATVQVPVDDNLWFIAAGGGGSSGYAFGEIGLRVLVAGNGDHGTVLLTPSLGGAALFGETEESCMVWNPSTQVTEPGTCISDIDYGGPMVGIAIEYRP